MRTILFIFLLMLRLANSTGTGRARRRLNPEASIVDELSTQLADGVEHPRFTIAANYLDGDSNLFTESALEPFEIDVVLTNPSVTESTSFSADGISSQVKNSIKLLVADQNIEDGIRVNNFAILAVDEKKGSVRGIVQKNKQLVQLEQLSGRPTTISEVIFDPGDNWTCFLDHDDAGIEHAHNDDSHTHKDHDNLRKLFTDIIGQHMEFDVDHSSQQTKLRQLYATDTFPNKWSYQVDLYIEVDEAFVNNHDTDTVNMPNTISYVNALVTAISAIYEQEVDTHLNVLHIAKTNIYDGAADVTVALDIMKEQYSGSTWHYTDPVSGQNPDLHHALLYRTPRAGYATVGGVCDSRIGYGVSSGVQGTLANVGTVYWDLVVMAHELGHNFGSRHTHDIAGYNPLVDACGNGQCTSLVTGNQVSTGDATIMSYCNTCPGGVKNMGTTFGGYWYEDNRSNINNWKNNDGAIPFSQEPKRVPKVLYEYVSSRGNCVKPYLPIEPQTCTVDKDCHDGNSCTIDTCSGGQCSNAMQSMCCGNFICEVGESNCSDCGPFTVKTPSCSTCVLPYGEMFDVEAINNITLTSIEFKIKSGTNTITIFTATGGYSNKQRNPNAWTQIYTGTFVATTNEIVSVDFDDIKVTAEAIQAFYIASTGQVAALANNNGSPLASDSNLKLLHPTRGVTATQFGSGYSNIISWVGSMSYRLEAPISSTTKPTAVSTPPPVTTSPTKIPSKSPSSFPTMKPINPPSSQPVTSQPQIMPSRNPTLHPYKEPTVVPSKPFTLGPVSSPTTLSPSQQLPPSSYSPFEAPTFSPSTNKPTAASGTPVPTKQLSTPNPMSPQPSKNSSTTPSSQPSKLSVTVKPTISSPSSRPIASPSKQQPTMQPLTGSPARQPTKAPVTFKPTTSSPSPRPITSPSTLKPTVPQPSKQPTTTQPTIGLPSYRPSQWPLTLKPTSSSPSIRPITSPPSMQPVTPSPTLLYSVDLCFPGCGNFTDVDTNNQFEDLILKFIPCRSKKCDVKVIAESKKCSVCKFPSLIPQRFLQDGSTSLQSSSITFEIVSVNPLNGIKVISNLNNNIENANNDLSTNESTFRVNGKYTTATLQPTRQPTGAKPTTLKPTRRRRPTLKPTRMPKKKPTRKPNVIKPATPKPTRRKRPTKKPARKPKSEKSNLSKIGKSTKSERIKSSKSNKKQEERESNDKYEFSDLTKKQKKRISKVDEEKRTKNEIKQSTEHTDAQTSLNVEKKETTSSVATDSEYAEVPLTKKEKKEWLKEDNSKSVDQLSGESHELNHDQLTKKKKKELGKEKRNSDR
eukprot:CCRYP_019454-RA/>CCRYP_019454-RA protein AED:0.10 eAED:0.10 QI:0/0.93/0.88/1/0.87/0.88/17/304/1304